MITELCICAGLGLEIDYSKKQECLDLIPNNSFGVFVTVRRFYKLKTYPEDIHGCIGYFSDKKLSKELLFEKMLSVSYSATWIDERRTYFPNILDESLTEYEIDFMLLPRYSIEDGYFMKNGKRIRFNNREYGLIVSGEYNATYLPDVFPNKNWNYIRNSLDRKAGSTGVYYAYEIKQYKNNIFSLFKTYPLYIMGEFNKYLNKNYKDFIPYVNNRVNRSEEVRNLATMYDIVRMSKYIRVDVLEKIRRDLDYYVSKGVSRQALSFMLLLYKSFNLETGDICLYLYKSLNELERDFELGEVLMSLTLVCPRGDILEREREKMLMEKKTDLFRLNWESKFVSLLGNREHLDEIYRKLKLIGNETNYLAVYFESLSNMFNGTDEMKNKLFRVFYELEKRRKGGLYRFTDGTGRLDITGHVLSGFYNLLEGL